MPNFTGAFGDVVTRSIKTLTAQSAIRQMSAGGKARSLLEVYAKEIDNVSILQGENLKKAFLPTTFGQFLDHYGASVGLTRYSQRSAEVLAEDRVFRFYVRGGGTFGSINNSLGFTVPAGTRLTSPSAVALEASSLYQGIEEPDNVFDRSIHYLTTDDAPVAADDTELYVAAKALTPGSAGNLAGPKMVKTHDFLSYDDYLGKSLLVENVKPVLNGIDDESAASYRYRISKQITAAQTSNEVAIASAALAVPGVADLVIIPWEDGSGRFNVYIKAISSVVSDKMVDDVQTAMDRASAVGVLGYARKPYEIGVEISSTVTFAGEYNDDVKNEIRDRLEVFLLQSLNSMSIGQPLSLVDLANKAKQSDGRIASVGFDKTTFFDGVFLWYPARLADGGKRRERLINEYLLVPPHARIIAESSISDPMRIV